MEPTCDHLFAKATKNQQRKTKMGPKGGKRSEKGCKREPNAMTMASKRSRTALKGANGRPKCI